jgi:Asp-tRNA(Asn)/Glu-tRNA(Gln) amidotransferase C subunit
LEKLFNRTKEQIDEELYLIEELKKIEFRKKERERRQQDVSKLLTAVGDLDNKNTSQSPQSTNNSNKKLKQQALSNQMPTNPNQRRISDSTPQTAQNKHKQSNQNSLNNSTDSAVGLVSPSNANESKNASNSSANANNTKKSLIFKAVVESAGIKFPDNKIAGVSLRSYKVKSFSCFFL